MRLSPAFALAAAVLACLSFAGCKQGLGQRCEQGDDCASGYCDYNAGGLGNPSGNFVCTGPVPPNQITEDASVPTLMEDASSADAPDGSEAGEVGGEVGLEAGAEASAEAGPEVGAEVGAEVGTEAGPETSPVEAGAAEAGAEAGGD